ncbi:MAG: hypothetical protein KY455_08130 [Euryarchaeota archaeon]|nr:hypothetical protein [Euryarchaeota archaeon]
MPFVSSDGPRLAIETTDITGRHRLSIPPALRLQLIAMLRRAQGTESRIQERPLSIARVYQTAVSGVPRRMVMVQYQERLPGNGMRMHRLAIPVDQLQGLISSLWDCDIDDAPTHPHDPSRDQWLM